jgi:rhodanese-related sulfurtransferase
MGTGRLATQLLAPATPPEGYADVSSEKFAELMRDTNAVVIDVRTPPEIANGKIAGAREIDYYSLDFPYKIAQLDTTKTYLIYCRSGNRSGKTGALMAKMGFDRLYNLAGGYLDWTKHRP